MASYKYALIAILLFAAVLRLWGLDRGDTINDEVFYAFRAVGILDFDAAEEQTTPLEWNEGVPWWTSLSFHDHPPLVFWVEHLFIKVFGENNFAFRLPSAILGVFSIYLLYLIGYVLFSQRTGLLAALLLGVTLNHVYITRTGMQEAYVIFFLLLSSVFFLKALKNEKYFIWLGVVLGFGFLVKYTVFIAVPVFLTYLLMVSPRVLLNKNLWIGAVLALVIFSPVLIYNLKLYQDIGHFDFQLSYIFGQRPEVWKVAPGKEIGTFYDRLKNFVPRLINSNSWLFLLVTAAALIAFFAAFVKNAQLAISKYKFLLFWLPYLFLLILFIGPAFRFLTVLTPFFALASAIFLVAVYEKWLWGRTKAIAYVLLGFLLVFEVFYSINNQIAYYPVGPSPWVFSKVRYENYNWGYNDLEKFLKEEFRGKMPAFTFDLEYKFLRKLQEKVLNSAKKRGLKPEPFLVVYGGNIDDGAKLWILERRLVYHGWPVIKLDDYFGFRQTRGEDYFSRSGFRNFYFVLASNTVFLPKVKKTVEEMTPTILRNQRGDEIFRIYKAIY